MGQFFSLITKLKQQCNFNLKNLSDSVKYDAVKNIIINAEKTQEKS